MKKMKVEADVMRAEYSLSGGAKNPYVARYAEGSNVVLIEPELFQAFPSEEEVNAALRVLLKAGTRVVKGKAQRRPSAKMDKAS